VRCAVVGHVEWVEFARIPRWPEAGAIIHATVGTLAGVEALNYLLSLAGGEFRMKLFESPPQRTMAQPWEYLLMEAARCHDEETSLLSKASVQAPSQPHVAEPALVTEVNHSQSDDEFVVVATYDGQWSPVDGSKS